jgi:signal transduction histidine kinase
MASLGELTAGIAHEIQNPLNFVNNFSEVNVELSEEIIESIKKGRPGRGKMSRGGYQVQPGKDLRAW